MNQSPSATWVSASSAYTPRPVAAGGSPFQRAMRSLCQSRWPCTSVMAAWANTSCLAASRLLRVCVPSTRLRKNVTWKPKARPCASCAWPVRYHHSVRASLCVPWSRGNTSSRGMSTPGDSVACACTRGRARLAAVPSSSERRCGLGTGFTSLPLRPARHRGWRRRARPARRWRCRRSPRPHTAPAAAPRAARGPWSSGSSAG